MGAPFRPGSFDGCIRYILYIYCFVVVRKRIDVLVIIYFMYALVIGRSGYYNFVSHY